VGGVKRWEKSRGRGFCVIAIKVSKIRGVSMEGQELLWGKAWSGWCRFTTKSGGCGRGSGSNSNGAFRNDAIKKARAEGFKKLREVGKRTTGKLLAGCRHGILGGPKCLARNSRGP